MSGDNRGPNEILAGSESSKDSKINCNPISEVESVVKLEKKSSKKGFFAPFKPPQKLVSFEFWLMSSAAHPFWLVEFLIFVLIFSTAPACRKKYSKFDKSKLMSCRGHKYENQFRTLVFRKGGQFSLLAKLLHMHGFLSLIGFAKIVPIPKNHSLITSSWD